MLGELARDSITTHHDQDFRSLDTGGLLLLLEF